MTNLQKFGLILVAILLVIYVKLAFIGSPDKVEPSQPEDVISNQEPSVPGEEEDKNDKKISKEYVNVFFIAHNSKGDEVYRAVKREYVSEYGSKLQFAIRSLINGPTSKEKSLGVYSEIPSGTKLLSILETPSKVIIDLSSEFEYGGGTDGLYKRLYQLIKTAKINTDLPVYLQLNGKQVDVIGGEGIMINQPLSEDFINE